MIWNETLMIIDKTLTNVDQDDVDDDPFKENKNTTTNCLG